jgi:hypothetical protein
MVVENHPLFEDRDSRFQNGQAERWNMGRESNNDAMICSKRTSITYGVHLYTSTNLH